MRFHRVGRLFGLIYPHPGFATLITSMFFVSSVARAEVNPNLVEIYENYEILNEASFALTGKGIFCVERADRAVALELMEKYLYDK